MGMVKGDSKHCGMKFPENFQYYKKNIIDVFIIKIYKINDRHVIYKPIWGTFATVEFPINHSSDL